MEMRRIRMMNSRSSKSGGVEVSYELENLLWEAVTLCLFSDSLCTESDIDVLYGVQLSLKGDSTTSGLMLQS